MTLFQKCWYTLHWRFMGEYSKLDRPALQRKDVTFCYHAIHYVRTAFRLSVRLNTQHRHRETLTLQGYWKRYINREKIMKYKYRPNIHTLCLKKLHFCFCQMFQIFLPNTVFITTTLWVKKKLDSFSFEHKFRKFCPVLTIISLLQTEIICPQTHNWISHFTYSLLLLHCSTTLIKATIAYTSSQKLLNKSAMHAVISLLLQSRKFWWYILLISSILLHDVIMTSYCCQR